MQLKVSRFIANGKVALGHFGFGRVKGHLVTSEPPLISDDCSSMNGGTSKVKINITAQVNILAFVGGLDFATLLAVDEKFNSEIKPQYKIQILSILSCYMETSWKM